MEVKYHFEFPHRVQAGFIGCGGHSWRNVYPAFQYAPVDLRAVCDLDITRAEAYGRQFGVAQAYASHLEMLDKEDLDAVFIVTGYDERGHPQAHSMALQALSAGCHVWMEKPPAASVLEVEALQEASRKADRTVMVGFKKMFFPAIVKVKEIADREEFGPISSVSLKYPQSLPNEEARLDDRKMVGFLDHIVHPASILQYVVGPTASLFFARETGGGCAATLQFRNGAVGTLHLSAGQSGMAPLERLEVVGRGASLVLENGVHLTYFRRGQPGPYGRTASFLSDDDQAPLRWEPEFSLGQLYNKNLFLLGYVPEILEFCDSILENRPPSRAGLEDTLEIMRFYEAFRGPEGQVISLSA